jgi:hypothetical protein
MQPELLGHSLQGGHVAGALLPEGSRSTVSAHGREQQASSPVSEELSAETCQSDLVMR